MQKKFNALFFYASSKLYKTAFKMTNDQFLY